MKELYGEGYKDLLNAHFQGMENQINSKLYDKAINFEVASETDMNISGLSDFIPFGHKQISANDFEKITDMLLNSDSKKSMLCSEFSAHIIIASIVELNRKIAKDMEDKGMKPHQEVIKIPFGKHENLHRVHPDRLLNILKDAGCAEKLKIESVKKVIGKRKIAKLTSKKSKQQLV